MASHEQCSHCHSYDVKRLSSTSTRGHMRPDTNSFISDAAYKALMNRIVGAGFVPGIIIGIILASLAFGPLRTIYQEPLSNAPLTVLSLFAIVLVAAVVVSCAIGYLQLGPAFLRRWKQVYRDTTSYRCQQCGRLWEDVSYTAV